MVEAGKDSAGEEMGGRMAMRKKLACLSLAACMAFAPVGGFVHGADQENSAGLLQAIETVKRVVDIPKEYSQFDYSSTQQKTGDKQVQVWSLSWTDPKGGGEISAQADPYAKLSDSAEQKGLLLSYYRYDKGEDQGPIGTVKREAAEQTALQFLNKALPSSVSGQMKQVGEDSSRKNTDSHRFRYMLYEKGIPVSPISVRIQVDKYSGLVTSYQGLAPGTHIPAFPDPKTAIDPQAAALAYLKQIGMDLQYHAVFDPDLRFAENSDEDKGARQAFLAYCAGGNGDADQLAIQGFSGKVWRMGGGLLPRGNFDEKSNAAMDGKEAAGLTPQEQKGLDQVSGLLTKDQAAAALKKQVPQLFGESSYQYASLNKNRNGGSSYQWDFSFETGSGSVDAASGEILSFYYGGEPGLVSQGGGDTSGKTKANVSEEQALAKARQLGEQLAGDVFKSCKQVRRITAENDPKPQREAGYSFRFLRQENGIDFVDNGIFITVDGTGQIRSYQRIWYDQINFPPIAGVMTAEQIFAEIQQTNPFRLAYEWADSQHNSLTLVYEFTDPVAGVLWSPADGQRLNGDGTPTKDETLPSYADIKGHWSETAVEELLANGYYIDGENFQPNRVITQSEFLRYLYSPDYSALSDKDFYGILERQGILKEGEAAPDQPLARQDGAKFLIRHMGLEQAAVHGELYKNFFSDSIDQGYQGYATLCYGLGIMGGEKGGAFAGEKNMTRAEAASAIYRMLLVK